MQLSDKQTQVVIDASVLALQQLLKLISTIRDQNNLDNAAIVARAKTQFKANENNLHDILASLP